MSGKTIIVKTPDGDCDSYISHPDANGPFPAVLIFMDAIGVRPALCAMADRIAAEGYYVLLPNLFYREGAAPVIDPGEILKPENRPKLMALVQSLTPDRVLSDAGTFLEFLGAQQDVAQTSKMGLVGYCMGGSMAVRTAAHFAPHIAAAASFHGGRLVTDAPDSPHRLLPQISAELYFGHADQDQSMPAEQIELLKEALDAAGNTYTAELYVGAPHGFTMSDLPHYDAAGCDKHWARLLDLFDRTLE